MSETPDLLAALQRSLDSAREARAMRAASDRRALAELRDRLDAIDDATTERVLDHLLREAPDMNRSLLREAAQIDPDAVADALRAEGAMP